MQYEIFYNTVYPSIKASLEAKGIITADKYEPATDFDGLNKFTILPNPPSCENDLLEANNYIEKLLKECSMPYAKYKVTFHIPHWYEYELILD